MTISDILREDGPYVEESILRIKKIDEKIKAFITVVDNPNGKIPIAVKDNIVTKGIRTTCASKILEDYIPPYNATVVDKLIKNDFAIVGKTNLDEFAMGTGTEYSAFFVTRNPWDHERVAGGSSGGSAAAVASGEVVAALGSDTGGSIRQPAAFCGVVGFKPTYGLVSRYGLVAFASSLDQIGPITKTTKDAAYLMNIIYGKDEKDATTVDKKIDFESYLEQDFSKAKVAYLEESFGEGVEEGVKERFEEFVKFLEKKGVKVEKVSLKELSYAVPTYYIIAPAEVSSNLSRFDGIRYGKREKEEG